VYKVEKYIAECIESILAQTYTKFRLILVDDGSPDNAGKICDEYAKKDSRITVIHQENAGVTRARAAGVEAAEDCEWITFVDSDDTIVKDALMVLLQDTNVNHDIIICCFDDKIKKMGDKTPNFYKL
jgi:glycosyltransferase involved in cell wall biosynthesis